MNESVGEGWLLGCLKLLNVSCGACLQFWQTHFPEGRQSWVPGKSPKVHAGFLDSWVKNSFGARITEKLCSIVRERLASSPQASMRIYVTGIPNPPPPPPPCRPHPAPHC